MFLGNFNLLLFLFSLTFAASYVIQLPFIDILIMLILFGIELLVQDLTAHLLRLCESLSRSFFFSTFFRNMRTLRTFGSLTLALSLFIAFCFMNLCTTLSFFYLVPVLAIYLGFLFGYNSYDLYSRLRQLLADLTATLAATIRLGSLIALAHLSTDPTPVTLLYLIILLLLLTPLMVRSLIRLHESPRYGSFFSNLTIVLTIVALSSTMRLVYIIVFVYCCTYPTLATLLCLNIPLLLLIPLIVPSLVQLYDSFFSKLKVVPTILTILIIAALVSMILMMYFASLTALVYFYVDFVYRYVDPTPVTLSCLIILHLLLILLIVRGLILLIVRGLLFWKLKVFLTNLTPLTSRVLDALEPYLADLRSGVSLYKTWLSLVSRIYKMWRNANFNSTPPSILDLALNSLYVAFAHCILSFHVANHFFNKHPLRFLLAICVGILFGCYYV